jgi:hypothetical protein
MFHQGQSFKPSASRENEISRLLDDARAGRLSYQRDPNREMPLGHAIAKNTTGADLAVGRPALYDGTFTQKEGPISNRKDWDPRKGYYTLIPPNPLEDGDVVGGLALTLEPIKQNQFGRVAVSGLALWLEQIVGGTYLNNFIVPTSTGFLAGDYGFGRCVATFDSMAVMDLSQTHLIAYYSLTSAWTVFPATATAAIGGPFAPSHTTTIRDGYNTGAPSYQRFNGIPNGDHGLVRWIYSNAFDYGQWHVVVPYC